MLTDSSLLYKYSAIVANLECMRKRGFLLFWFFEICGLQFGIVKEVCCRLVLQFFLFSLSWCVATFGFDLWLSLWFLHNLYLVFLNRWFFGLYLVLWFVFGSSVYICERESNLGAFGIWVCESASTPICIIPNFLIICNLIMTKQKN